MERSLSQSQEIQIIRYAHPADRNYPQIAGKVNFRGATAMIPKHYVLRRLRAASGESRLDPFSAACSAGDFTLTSKI